MYDPNYKETLSDEEVLKTIAVSLVVNGGMRLGTNISKGNYEVDADGMLQPLDEAKMMGQVAKGADEPKIMEMEGDESEGLSGIFKEMGDDRAGISVDDNDIINNTLDNATAEEIAFGAIQGSDKADSVVLGKFEAGSANSYERVAQDYRSQYFQIEDSQWNELSAQYSDEEMWKINEKFLDIQIASGRDIYLSHDPGIFRDRPCFFSKEILYLESHGFRFAQEGDFWHAVFK